MDIIASIEQAENPDASDLISLEMNKNTGIVEIPLIELKDLVQFEAFLQFSKGKTITVTRSEIENAGERVLLPQPTMERTCERTCPIRGIVYRGP